MRKAVLPHTKFSTYFVTEIFQITLFEVDLLVWGAQRRTASLCSPSQWPSKAVLVNYSMETGPFLTPFRTRTSSTPSSMFWLTKGLLQECVCWNTEDSASDIHTNVYIYHIAVIIHFSLVWNCPRNYFSKIISKKPWKPAISKILDPRNIHALRYLNNTILRKIGGGQSSPVFTKYFRCSLYLRTYINYLYWICSQTQDFVHWSLEQRKGVGS